MKDFEFLTSVRFWKLFVVALAGFSVQQGWIPQDVATALAVWLGGSVVVRTVDKLGGN